MALYVCSFSLQSALAIGITGSICVGQQLGAGSSLEAKRVFHLVLVIMCKQNWGVVLEGGDSLTVVAVRKRGLFVGLLL